MGEGKTKKQERQLKVYNNLRHRGGGTRYKDIWSYTTRRGFKLTRDYRRRIKMNSLQILKKYE